MIFDKKLGSSYGLVTDSIIDRHERGYLTVEELTRVRSEGALGEVENENI
jgi:hypothetical protein